MLLHVLTRAGHLVTAVCGGKGQCGHCRIKISHPRKPSSIDKKFISPGLIKQGYRLACQYRITKNAKISIPIKKNKRDKRHENVGLALDLGTTVIKGAVIDIESNKIVRLSKTYNLQNNFGADVITRISTALDGKYNELRRLLMRSIEKLKIQLNVKNPSSMVIVGNPVMSSFFLNKPLDGLARHPFTSAVNRVFIQSDPPVFVFPAIASFVGGDALAGILASELDKAAQPSLYIDLGTNGEVVLASRKHIFVASTAAGPAFEGSGLSSGCLAIPGAVNQVMESRGRISFRTIGNRSPIGFCASGLIDLLAIALKNEWLSPDGRLHVPIENKGLSLTQSDVRKLQLSISAIHTGIRLLLEKADLIPDRIKTVILSGEFGSALNQRALIRTGLLPDINAKITGEPDLALKGAIMLLKDSELQKSLNRIKKKCIHVDIAREPSFERTYINSLTLTPWK